MAHHIFPSQNAVGSFNGYSSRYIYEPTNVQYALRMSRSPLPSYCYTGCSFSIVASALSLDIGAGEFIINGYWCVSDATDRLTGLTANMTGTNGYYYGANYIWAVLDFSSGIVTAFHYASNTTGTAPSTNSLLLGVAYTDANDVTSVDNCRLNYHSINGSYLGSGTANRYIFIGARPRIIGMTVKSAAGAAANIGVFHYTTNDGTKAADSNIASCVYPWSEEYGFKVSHDATYGSLNASGGLRYYYFVAL